MRDAKRYLACAAMLAVTLTVVAQDLPQPAGQPNPENTADDSFSSGDPQPSSNADPAAVAPTTVKAHVGRSTAPKRRTQHDRMIGNAAMTAYNSSFEVLRAGKTDDPEPVYRWSRRIMKAQQMLEDNEANAARDHLRRMSDLAIAVEVQAKKENKDAQEYNFLISAVDYYRREAQKLFEEATARRQQAANIPLESDPLATEQPRAPGADPYQIAQAYLDGVLQGDVEAAIALSRPGSPANSKQRIEEFNALVDRDIVQLTGVHYPEPGKGRAVAYTSDVQLAKAQPDGRDKGPLAITLTLEKGRWLVTDLDLGGKELQQWIRRSAADPFHREPFPGSFRDPPATKKIHVLALKHAHAKDLVTTVTNLLGTGTDLQMVADERTNSVLVHGTSDRVAEVEALIKQLDAPGPERTTDGDGGADSTRGLIQPRGNYGGAR